MIRGFRGDLHGWSRARAPEQVPPHRRSREQAMTQQQVSMAAEWSKALSKYFVYEAVVTI